MKKYLLLAGALLVGSLTNIQAQTNNKKPATMRSILLQQFLSTWNEQDWFVPVSKAVDGLTAQQAMWKPSDSSHSVGQLAYHLLYWNKEQLDKFYGRKPAPFSGDNNETFTAFTESSWAATVQQLNQVMKDWADAIRQADDSKLESWYSIIANVNTHNAYHTGQILYIRKLAGNWDSNKGVK